MFDEKRFMFYAPDDVSTGTPEAEKPEPEVVGGEPVGEVEKKEPSAEERLQQMMVENVKLKKAQEKAAMEAADFKKKYNATLSEKDRADMEKAEKAAALEEEFNRLKRENKITKLEKDFIKLGYSEEAATKAAEAQYDGDAETLFKLQRELLETTIKAKEAEWLRSRPKTASGQGEGDEEDPFLKGFQL